MRSLGFEESKVCKVGVWATEKAGRARLIIAGDEPAVWDWRSLCKGSIMEVTGKKLMWVTLAAVKSPELNSYNFEQLQRRAEQQLERIEAERISAIRQELAGAIRSK
jgi:hypothetical protein